MIALHIAPAIRPGGGPAGYCYNLMQGSKAALEHQADIDFRFHGSVGTRTTASTSGRAFRLKARLKMWLEYLGLKDISRRLSSVFGGRVPALIGEVSNADFVVFHGPASLALLERCIRDDKKIIYMPHSPSISADEHKMILALNGITLPAKVYWQRFAEEQEFFAKADIVVFPSPGASEQYRQRYDISDGKIRYILSGVSDPRKERDASVERAHDSAVIVLFAGRYVDHKGYDIFCEASEVHQYENVKFVTAGSGPLERPYKKVTNLGWRSDIFEVIKNADIIVIPNRIAYYDLLPIECAALGKPIILTDVGGSRDQAALLPDCLLAVANDCQSVAENIAAATSIIRANPRWGSRNRVAYEHQFNDALMATRWKQMLRSIN